MNVKKKILAVGLMAAMLVTVCGTAFADTSSEKAASGSVTVNGSNPDFSSALPAVDATVLCMYECGYECRPSDNEFYWTALCYMLGIYAENDERAEFTDTTMSLPREVVEDYAASLFTNYTALPAIPANLHDFVTYNAADDTYAICRGDKGLTETVLGNSISCGTDSWLVEGQVKDLENGSSICSFQVILTASDGMFGYTVSDLMIVS